MNEVADVVARWFLALDDHDWDAVMGFLGDTVRRDYQSLFGIEPDEPAGPDLVAEWRGVLTGLDAHQHLLGPPVVTVAGDEARAAAHVVGTHVLAGDPGSPWVVGGTYRFGAPARRWPLAHRGGDARHQLADRRRQASRAGALAFGRLSLPP